MESIRDARPSPAPVVPRGAFAPFPVLPISVSADSRLLRYYVLSSLVLGPFFLFALVPLYFRYHTLRYDIDAEGISMRWGVLFRREITLTYARIQDIHLSSNVIERWLGLARIQVQTASGSASAEMTIEGMAAHEAVRDFLYSRMRGAREQQERGAPELALSRQESDSGGEDELTATLRTIASELRAIRGAIAPAGLEGPGEGPRGAR